MTIDDLITDLEKATEPSPDLDAKLFCAVSPSPFEYYPGDCVLAVLGGFRARVELDEIPPYTSSLDRALEIPMSGGNCYGFDGGPRGFDAFVSLNNVEAGHWLVEGSHPTSPVIATVIARLKAMRRAVASLDDPTAKAS